MTEDSAVDGDEPDDSTASWWQRTRYRLYAPIYDWVVWPMEAGRRRAIERLSLEPDDEVLILGCGTGRDLEYLPADVSVTAIDLTPNMVDRTRTRAATLGMDVDARVGDAQSTDLPANSFDAVLCHLILTVVPEPEALAAEAARLVAPDGRVSIYDKFAPEGRPVSLWRRAIDPVTRTLFSSFTRKLEPLFAETDLVVRERESALGGLYEVAIARPATDA